MKNLKRKNPNLLFITEFFPSKDTLDIQGGVEMRTYHLTKKLAQKYPVSVIASKEKGKPDKQILNNIHVVRVGITRQYGQRFKGDFLKRLFFMIMATVKAMKIKADLIEGSFIGQIPALITAKFKKVKAVAFVADVYHDEGYKFGFIQNLFLLIIDRLIFNNFWDGFIVISKVIGGKLAKKVNKNKIKLIYCGIDVNQINCINMRKTKLPSICAISRLVSYKKVDIILKAFKLVISKLPKTTLNIIGSGEDMLKLQQLVKDLDLDDKVVFHGFVPRHEDVIKRLKQSWFYCSASVMEGFGITTVESIASGVPFIISDIPVNREITLEKGGLFFQPNQPVDLAEKLNLLINNQTLRKQLVKDNEQIINIYDNGRMVKKTEALYLALLNKKIS